MSVAKRLFIFVDLHWHLDAILYMRCSTRLDLYFEPNRMLPTTVTTCPVWAANELTCAKQAALATAQHIDLAFWGKAPSGFILLCVCVSGSEWDMQTLKREATGERKERKAAQMKGGLMSSRVTVCGESCEAAKQRGLTSNCVWWGQRPQLEHRLGGVMLDDQWKTLQEAEVGHHSPFEATLGAVGFHSGGPCSSRFSPPVVFSCFPIALFLFTSLFSIWRITLDDEQIISWNVCIFSSMA